MTVRSRKMTTGERSDRNMRKRHVQGSIAVLAGVTESRQFILSAKVLC